MKKIAFSGVPASGKTSVVAEISKILSLKHRIAEVEDICRKNPFDVDQKSKFSSQFFFVTTQINDENIKGQENPDLLLCDRSVLDQWIYWQKYVSEKEMTDRWQEKNELMKSIFKFWIKSYDLIFHIRVGAKEQCSRNSGNEVRSCDAEYIRQIEELYLVSIREEHLGAIEVWNNLTIDETAQQVIQTISDLKFI